MRRFLDTPRHLSLGTGTTEDCLEYPSCLLYVHQYYNYKLYKCNEILWMASITNHLDHHSDSLFNRHSLMGPIVRVPVMKNQTTMRKPCGNRVILSNIAVTLLKHSLLHHSETDRESHLDMQLVLSYIYKKMHHAWI